MHKLSIRLCALGIGVGAFSPAAHAQSEAVALATHRAVYDLSLDASRAAGSIQSIRGRMVYELSGSVCEGWQQAMRFVTDMAGQDGTSTVSDLRSTTWEDAAATLFRFNSTNIRDQKPSEETVGDAKRAGKDGPITVEVTRPTRTQMSLSPGTYFPVQHSIALLVAAKAGRQTLRVNIYDGSEKGTKVYDTIARIGRLQAAGANSRLPAVANAEPLDRMPSWPVTISYYETGQEGKDATPVYELGFLYFENGVSRTLKLDYGDFAIKGELTRLEFLPPAECKTKN